MYGMGENERVLGKALAGARRERVVIATKFGNILSREGDIVGISGRKEFVRLRCEDSLRRLGIDTIDLFQQHRIDRQTPVEETVGAMYELVEEGKVRFIGLGEALPVDILRAAKTAPISTLQCEYSLTERFVERETLDTCEVLGIGLLAYAPLGRGLLTGRFRNVADFPEGDKRGSGLYPRLEDNNLRLNHQLVREVEAIALERDVTAPQVALAWLLAQSDSLVPIPGTRNIKYLEENVAAATIELSREDLARLDALVPSGGGAAGERYNAAFMPTWVSPPFRAPVTSCGREDLQP
jgi:aryl-alcohol dehydrogenase-like predicted oxidoreductase